MDLERTTKKTYRLKAEDLANCPRPAFTETQTPFYLGSVYDTLMIPELETMVLADVNKIGLINLVTLEVEEEAIFDFDSCLNLEKLNWVKLVKNSSKNKIWVIMNYDTGGDKGLIFMTCFWLVRKIEKMRKWNFGKREHLMIKHNFKSEKNKSLDGRIKSFSFCDYKSEILMVKNECFLDFYNLKDNIGLSSDLERVTHFRLKPFKLAKQFKSKIFKEKYVFVWKSFTLKVYQMNFNNRKVLRRADWESKTKNIFSFRLSRLKQFGYFYWEDKDILLFFANEKLTVVRGVFKKDGTIKSQKVENLEMKNTGKVKISILDKKQNILKIITPPGDSNYLMYLTRQKVRVKPIVYLNKFKYYEEHCRKRLSLEDISEGQGSLLYELDEYMTKVKIQSAEVIADKFLRIKDLSNLNYIIEENGSQGKKTNLYKYSLRGNNEYEYQLFYDRV